MEAGLEVGGSWGVRCPLTSQTCCFSAALIAQVLEKLPETRRVRPAASTSPRRSVSLSHRLHRTPSPRRQRRASWGSPWPRGGTPRPSCRGAASMAQPQDLTRVPGRGPCPGGHAEGLALGGLAPGCQRVRGWLRPPSWLAGEMEAFVEVPSQSPFGWEAVPTAAPWRTCGQYHSFSMGPRTGCLPRRGAEGHRRRGHVGA